MTMTKKKLPRLVHGQPVYEAIQEMSTKGMRETDIARCLGISFNVWARIKEEDQQALDALEAGRCKVHTDLVGTLVSKALAGDTTCLLFALKCMFGYREYAPIDDGGPRVKINFELPGSANPADYLKILEGEKAKRLTHDDD